MSEKNFDIYLEFSFTKLNLSAFDQLNGKAGDRTVKNAKIGLTQNFGATGASCAVHIFHSVLN